jgi:hypothetical protein
MIFTFLCYFRKLVSKSTSFKNGKHGNNVIGKTFKIWFWWWAKSQSISQFKTSLIGLLDRWERMI